MSFLLAGERERGESRRAIVACNDWLRLGPGRSLPRLLAGYAEQDRNAPTRSMATLKRWSSRYGWERRADAYDAAVDAERTRYAESVMRSGLGLPHERVLELKRLAETLKTMVYERDKEGRLTGLWLRDAKMIGAGEGAERVDIERFNARLVEQFRAVLDDLAKETGGRNPRVQVAVGQADLADLLREVHAALPPAEPGADGDEA